ncbi:hypothetical protein TNCV_353251 [Trichonephila clavipes]|nr:hypothetical protein TNCV_353251 [Trichonephila clavipes]
MFVLEAEEKTCFCRETIEKVALQGGKRTKHPTCRLVTECSPCGRSIRSASILNCPEDHMRSILQLRYPYKASTREGGIAST